MQSSCIDFVWISTVPTPFESGLVGWGQIAIAVPDREFATGEANSRAVGDCAETENHKPNTIYRYYRPRDSKTLHCQLRVGSQERNDRPPESCVIIRPNGQNNGVANYKHIGCANFPPPCRQADHQQ